jgi:ribonucleoside-diphosphate reductase alpha chain
VWNGEVFSEVDVIQTGHDQELLVVELSNGATLTCTPYHKFLVQESYTDKRSIADALRIDAQDLKPGMKLKKSALPTLAGDASLDIKDSYTHGFFCGDGTYTAAGRPQLCLYGEKKALVPHLAIRTMSGVEDASGRLNTWLHEDIAPKFKVPIGASLGCRLAWLAGLADADGSIARNGDNESLQVSSINLSFLKDIQTMLTETGVQAKVTQAFGGREAMLPDGRGGYAPFKCQPLWRLLISSSGLYHLSTLGFKTQRLTWTPRKPQRCAEQFTRVVNVFRTGRHDDTYCFTEPLNHAGVFNGILTGQCTEIFEYTSADETAVCNLGSLALPRFVKDGVFDFEALRRYTHILTRNLNKVIDLNFYPTEKCRRSNLRHRPIGIGVQGLADVFAKMRLPWTSEGAAKLNREIFENIYYAAVDESSIVSMEACQASDHYDTTGAYETFQGSPASRGELQFDLWKQTPRETPYLDWERLKLNVKTFGMRNSLLLAPMPTASTSQILGNNECIEPFTSNLYSRRVLAGEFVVVNKYLVDDLVALGLWTPDIRAQIIANNGSVQGIAEIPMEVRELYRTAWEIPMKTIITLAADRAPFICQSQSLNLFVAEPTYSKLSSMHLFAWKQGLKTGCYYLRTKSVAKAQQFTVEPPACTTCSA